MKGLSDIQKRLKALWADKRSFRTRLLLAGIPMLAFCFTFVFFGPLEMVAFSEDTLSYSWHQILAPMGLTALVLWIGGTLALSLLRGKLFNNAVTLVFAITIGGYLQAMFFNGDLGSLTGDAILWDGLKSGLIVNSAVWAVMLLLPYFLLYLSRELWKKMLVFLSALLILMQLVPAVAIFAGVYDSGGSGIIKYALTDDGMYEYSSQDNIFVFVLDRMDFTYLEKVQRADPDILEPLDGFTAYSNATSRYARTRPALNQMLTASDAMAYEVGSDVFLRDSWTENGKDLLGGLREQGYTVELYAMIQDLFSDPAYVLQRVTNVTSDKGDINNVKLIQKLLYFSAYRYGPLSMKPFFWSDTNFYNSEIYRHSTVYAFDDAGYAPGFRESTADRQQGSFKFYHFNGPHEPFVLNADGTLSEDGSTLEAQMEGSLRNLYAAFDRMKELGIYEDATIIITADHGSALSDLEPLQAATRIGLFLKPSGSAGTALAWSQAPVSTDNIPATIAKAAGLETAAYGTALEDVAEDDGFVRSYFKSVNEGASYATVYEYEIHGDASRFENWVEVKIHEPVNSFY